MRHVLRVSGRVRELRGGGALVVDIVAGSLRREARCTIARWMHDPVGLGDVVAVDLVAHDLHRGLVVGREAAGAREE